MNEINQSMSEIQAANDGELEPVNQTDYRLLSAGLFCSHVRLLTRSLDLP